jgi:hypothetical protein
MGFFARHAATEPYLRKSDELADVEWHWRYHVRVLPLIATASILLLAVEEMASLAVWALEPGVAWLDAERRDRLKRKSG